MLVKAEKSVGGGPSQRQGGRNSRPEMMRGTTGHRAVGLGSGSEVFVGMELKTDCRKEQEYQKA